LVKPLGGTDDEITGIFKPLANEADKPQSYDFSKPSEKSLGDFTSAKLLYNAARLSFRNTAGPFRCLGKLSFRPRSYQMVPLIMALKKDITRLLIADDVGVGKTIEALLIAKELYERKEISRFAIVCLPHLCDQWQDELKSKFGMEAVIIRSGTATALERQIRTNESIFEAFPFQIISIDYIKTGNKGQIFLSHCPKLIIVDEAHTCAKPAGANDSQQLRYKLLKQISKNPIQNLILLTATPHSGKQEEFQSLLGLLKPEFEEIDIVSSTEQERKEIADHFVQRRRGDVLKWLDEETKFPKRNPIDKDYEIGEKYFELFNEVLAYAREMVALHADNGKKQRYNYWDALALLRGIMSSPAAGISMLHKKAQKKKLSNEEDEGTSEEAESQSVMDTDYSADDNLPLSVLAKANAINDSESKRLLGYAKKMEGLMGVQHDQKVKEALSQIKTFIENGYNPIIFCRYIQTANYLGTVFKEALKSKSYKDLLIEVVTSELNDELRREKIQAMYKAERRLLIATDCLSEGINLQEGFNALLHYDLPWNPNRLEQREGRIDRFGQQSASVEVALLYGSNNPIDGVVLEVLLRKAQEIRKSTGVAVPFPENSASVMEAVTKDILLKPVVTVKQVTHQLSIFEAAEIEEEKNRIAKAFDEAEQREKTSRSIFAKNSIKAHEINDDLKEVDEAIGDVKTVEQFIIDSLRFMGVQVEEKKLGYKVYATNIPQRLRELLTNKNDIQISFQSPTPFGYKYIGRNHPFTEHLSQFVINNALQGAGNGAARASVLRTNAVKQKTVLFQLRVRNVIAEQPSNKQVVAEEMWLWGYEGDLKQKQIITKQTAMDLLMDVKATQNMEQPEQASWLSEEMEWVKDETIFRAQTDAVALERANHLVHMHTKVRNLLGGIKYKVVEPVLPMDVLGLYILLPELKK
jgi:superfamily II DNA or RNA helicase